jgi:hypothetical protein
MFVYSATMISTRNSRRQTRASTHSKAMAAIWTQKLANRERVLTILPTALSTVVRHLHLLFITVLIDRTLAVSLTLASANTTTSDNASPEQFAARLFTGRSRTWIHALSQIIHTGVTKHPVRKLVPLNLHTIDITNCRSMHSDSAWCGFKLFVLCTALQATCTFPSAEAQSNGLAESHMQGR